MTVKDIYVIDPEYYRVYQQSKRQAYRLEILSTIIKILLLTLFLVVAYFSYKIIEKKGLLSQFLTPKESIMMTTPSHLERNHYLEVPARAMAVIKEPSVVSAVVKESTTQEIRQVPLEPIRERETIEAKQEKMLSSDYLKRIEQELHRASL